MIDLKYSLIVEATSDPNFFGFFSPDLEGFTGVGHSIEDCLYKAKWGMEEHVALLVDQNLPVPAIIPIPLSLCGTKQRYSSRLASRGSDEKNLTVLGALFQNLQRSGLIND